MPRLPESTRDAIKQAVDLIALVGEYGLQLHRAGSKFKALCPFHDDHNPSLILDPDRQSYKCWACGAGGDVFSFVQAHERIDFPEALRMLADRAGIALETAPAVGRARPAVDAAGPGKSELLAACVWAERQFVAALDGSDEAYGYLEARGITPESVQRFALGFAPDERDWLPPRARAAGIAMRALEAAGLVSRKEGSNLTFDRFRGRLIFPIRDPMGRTIGFGGRILPSVERKYEAELGRKIAKYLNSPETPLFQKRRNLYAADLARPAARREGWVGVVEGYTDVIAAHQVGLENVVGTLGTALGDEHIQALRRLADRVVLVFDGDEAGQKAADRSLELFLGHEVDVRVIRLPEGLDPADFLSREGVDAFRKLVEGASDPLDYAVDRAAERFDVEGIEGARQAAEWVLGHLASSPRLHSQGITVKVGQALNKLADRLHLPIRDRTLTERLKHLMHQNSRAARSKSQATDRDRGREPSEAQALSGPASPAPEPPTIRPADLDPTDRELIDILWDDPSLVAQLARDVPVTLLREGPLRTILAACFDAYADGELPTFDAVAARLDERTRSLAAGIGFRGVEAGPLPHNIKPAAREARLAGVLAALAERDRRERLRDVESALREIDPAASPQEFEALRRELFRLRGAIHTQSRPEVPEKSAS